MELWNIKNASYLQLSALGALNTTSESLFMDAQEAVVERIAVAFDIGRRSKLLVDYTASTKERQKDGSYYRRYYLNELWREELSSEAIAIINETVDRSLMTHFGYERLS